MAHRLSQSDYRAASRAARTGSSVCTCLESKKWQVLLVDHLAKAPTPLIAYSPATNLTIRPRRRPSARRSRPPRPRLSTTRNQQQQRCGQVSRTADTCPWPESRGFPGIACVASVSTVSSSSVTV